MGENLFEVRYFCQTLSGTFHLHFDSRLWDNILFKFFVVFGVSCTCPRLTELPKVGG